jgi:phosphatidylinositol glycan class B
VLEKKERYVVLLCVLGFLLSSIFSIGFHHYDEHFQLLEFAALKLNLTDPANLPWEYHNQMRPAMQPAIVVGLYNSLSSIGIGDPFVLSFLLRLLSASLAFYTMWLVYKTFRQNFTDARLKHWFLLLSFLLWFGFYLGTRFSSENWSGIAFTLAFCLYFSQGKPLPLKYVYIGLLLGGSFVFRYQAGFLAFGFFAWMVFIKRERILHLVTLLLAALAVVFLGILADRWFYGEWTFTAWNYIDQNLIQDKVSGFGTEPWWWYFTAFLVQAVPPLSILFLAAFAVVTVLKPKSPVIWSILPFLGIHLLIGHKELRFLFPLVFFLPVLFVEAITLLKERTSIKLHEQKWFNLLFKGSLVINFAFMLVVWCKPADSTTALYRSLYRQYEEPSTLFYTHNNPYHRVLDVYFYKRPNLEVQAVENLNALPPISGRTLVVFDNYHKPEVIPENYILVYTSFPSWIKAFNVNNWQARTDMWFVYEVEQARQ